MCQRMSNAIDVGSELQFVTVSSTRADGIAASAYLSREPLLLGSLRGQDWGKLLVIAATLVGVILQILGVNWFTNLFRL